MYLAIDTSTQVLSVALHDGRQVLAETTWPSAMNHTLELGPRVATILASAQVSGASALKGVAVALGPGTFTGLRAGIAFAKGLALAGPTPLVGVPALDVLVAAQARPTHERATLVAVLSAGRGRMFAALYRWQGLSPAPSKARGEKAEKTDKAEKVEGDQAGERWVQTLAPHIVTWDSLLAEIEGEPLLFCGEIDATGAAAIKKLGRRARLATGAQSLRRAGYLAELALERFLRGEFDNPATLVPLYLREPGGKPA